MRNEIVFPRKSMGQKPIPNKAPEDNKIRGVGDLVAKVAEPIKAFAMKHGPQSVQDYLSKCNCAERRAYLNKHFPLNVN